MACHAHGAGADRQRDGGAVAVQAEHFLAGEDVTFALGQL
jgi:hypothetical protein